MSVLLAPLALRLGRYANPPPAARFLIVWLLFRLIFASSVVKLTSGDPAWIDGTALQYHYFTQPLPTPLAWFAQQLPATWQTISVWTMFAIELVLPFFSFRAETRSIVRGSRHCNASALDRAYRQLWVLQSADAGPLLGVRGRCGLETTDAIKVATRSRRRSTGTFCSAEACLAAALAIFLFSLVPLAAAFRRPMPFLGPLMMAYDAVAPFRTINGYGLFAVMTKERREILVQGSDDGVTWKAYTFRFKPGDPRRAPPWVAPYMPRLDWQMWFAALGTAERNPWFLRFLERLLEGSPAVSELLEENPFENNPPRFVRALSDRYTFTTMAEGRRTGLWWSVEPTAIYFPAVSLEAR